jgi:hypothetical protein
MKRWYLYLITLSLGAVIVAYVLVRWNVSLHFADMWSTGNQAKNTQSDAGRLSRANAVPNDKRELWQTHQLRPLTELENGTKTQGLPNGIYGFSMCNVVSLSAKRDNPSALEIHKHRDGIVYYVGYASDEHIGNYLTRQKNFHILTSPHPREGATSLFEIPVEFVAKCEERPLKEGYLFDLFVTAIPELQS